MVDYCREGSYFSTAECIVPVPLGIKKLRHREFNQSLILAKVVGKYLNVPVYPFALKKVKEPASQMELSKEDRIRNVRGAFVVRKNKHINQKEVLLVDDVFTTGATIKECSRVLLKQGAKKVWALTLARTILH
jgi:competence protein ComFC